MRLENVTFLTVEEVIELHDDAMSLYTPDEDRGILNRNLLESAVMSPQSGYYGSLAEMAAVYAHGLACNHAFANGNKRVAAAAAIVFLKINGFGPSVYITEDMIVDLVLGKLTRDDLVTLLAVAMGGDELITDDSRLD